MLFWNLRKNLEPDRVLSGVLGYFSTDIQAPTLPPLYHHPRSPELAGSWSGNLTMLLPRWRDKEAQTTFSLKVCLGTTRALLAQVWCLYKREHCNIAHFHYACGINIDFVYSRQFLSKRNCTSLFMAHTFVIFPETVFKMAQNCSLTCSVCLMHHPYEGPRIPKMLYANK